VSPTGCGTPLPEVLVMAGGQGRRLGALTASTPKPMLPVAGRPVLQHILEQLRDQGVRHAFVSVHHLGHVISQYFGDGRWLGIDIDYVKEHVPLGTAGAMSLLPPLDKTLLVVNGDVVTPLPVARFVGHHQKHAAALSVGCVEQCVTVPYGVLELKPPDVVGLDEKPDIVVTVAAGVYLFSPEVVRTIGPRGARLSMPELISNVLRTGRVVGFPLPGPWVDIGTPATYACAEQVIALAASRATPLVDALLASTAITVLGTRR
jgi:NDP-sugar pyrophosphorylase family protein